MKNLSLIATTAALTSTLMTASYAAPPANVPPSQNVRVINTPSQPVPVTVQNATTGITIENSEGNPVPTIRADEPALQPYAQRKFADVGGLALVATVNFDVPAGKRLVIETVTAEVLLPSTSTPRLSIGTTRDGEQTFHWLSTTLQGLFLSTTRYLTSQSLRLYSDAGDGSVTVLVGLPGSVSRIQLDASISGYLVDVP